MNAYIIDQTALEQNIAALQRRAGDTVIWGVVKGDGYGLGCVRLARVLAAQGICHFAVTRVEEAAALRAAGLKTQQILMMECISQPEQIRQLLDEDVILTVGALEDAARIASCARESGHTARVHVKVDTGMGRYGFLPEQLEDMVQVYTQYPALEVTGIFTHFYDSGVEAPTQKQFDLFCRVLEQLRERGITPGMTHCCNSSAFIRYPRMHMDAVRIGSGFLGRLTVQGVTDLVPLGYCQARLEQIRTLPAGHTVGYGAGFVTKAPTRIGVVRVGYINGFAVDRGYDLWRPVDCLRGVARYVKAFFRKKALYVQVNGKPCRVLGHVGMVNMVIDVTHCPCALGDSVRLEINPLLVRNMEIVFR